MRGVRQAERLGRDAAAVLGPVAHQQVGAPRGAHVQQVGGHAARPHAREHVPRHERRPLAAGEAGGGLAQAHQLRIVPFGTGAEEGEAEPLDHRREAGRRGHGHGVPGGSHRLGQRDERVEVAQARRGGEQDAHGRLVGAA